MNRGGYITGTQGTAAEFILNSSSSTSKLRASSLQNVHLGFSPFIYTNLHSKMSILCVFVVPNEFEKIADELFASF